MTTHGSATMARKAIPCRTCGQLPAGEVPKTWTAAEVGDMVVAARTDAYDDGYKQGVKEIEALKAKAERLERRLVNAGHVSDVRWLELTEKFARGAKERKKKDTMPDPKTNQELNEAVAKKLDLVYEIKGERVVIWPGADDPRDDSIFDPANKPADAFWALNKLCDDRGWAWATFRNRPNSAGNPKRFGCVIGPNEQYLEHCDIEDWCATIEEAICCEIVGAAK